MIHVGMHHNNDKVEPEACTSQEDTFSGEAHSSVRPTLLCQQCTKLFNVP